MLVAPDQPALQTQTQTPPPPTPPLVVRSDGQPLAVTLQGQALTLRAPDGHSSSWRLAPQADPGPLLAWSGTGEPATTHLLAAIEAAFILLPTAPRGTSLRLRVPGATALHLTRQGWVTDLGDGDLRVATETFWQTDRLWLPEPTPPFPQRHVMSPGGRRHPLRPPKPDGIVYQRTLPWLPHTLSFATAHPVRDLAGFHRWMNDPVVAHFWEEEGDLVQHRQYLERIASDPHTLGLIGRFGDQPFGYFEVYWAKEDRIAPFCDATDHDRGWHVLVGEAQFRGKPYVTAWLPSIAHYMFLDDCRTQRIVIEPRVDNHKMICNLALGGYALVKEFDFPHKRALLGCLLRERFFSERLWVPRDTAAAPPSVPAPSLFSS